MEPRKRNCNKCHQESKTLRKCSQCRLVAYCTIECQKADWKEHKAICNSISNVGHLCSHCGKYGKVKRCASCRIAYYCNRECQKNAWPLHKKDCKQVGSGLTYIIETSGGQKQSFDYYYKNTTAKDLLRLSQNEGTDYQGTLRLLSIGFCDLADIIRTLAGMEANPKLEVHLMDFSPYVITRSALLLLILQQMIATWETNKTKYESLRELFFFTWYSSALTREQRKALTTFMQKLATHKAQAFKENRQYLNVEFVDVSFESVDAVSWCCETFQQCYWTLDQVATVRWNMRGQPTPEEFYDEFINIDPMDAKAHAFVWSQNCGLGNAREINPTMLCPYGTTHIEFVYSMPPAACPFLGWEFHEMEQYQADHQLDSLYDAFEHMVLDQIDACVATLFRQARQGTPVNIFLCNDQIANVQKYPLIHPGFDRVYCSNLSDHCGGIDAILHYCQGLLNRSNASSALLADCQNWATAYYEMDDKTKAKAEKKVTQASKAKNQKKKSIKTRKEGPLDFSSFPYDLSAFPFDLSAFDTIPDEQAMTMFKGYLRLTFQCDLDQVKVKGFHLRPPDNNQIFENNEKQAKQHIRALDLPEYTLEWILPSKQKTT